MLEAGEDPLFVARRLVVLASEDVGLADPQALSVAIAAQQAAHFVGMPEGYLPLAEPGRHSGNDGTGRLPGRPCFFPKPRSYPLVATATGWLIRPCCPVKARDRPGCRRADLTE